MATKPKDTRPRCQNHRRRLGRVACATCGAWLCYECATDRTASAVCKNTGTCTPLEDTQPPAAAGNDTTGSSTLRGRSIRAVLWTLAGILLAAGTFFPHSARESIRLRAQVRSTAGKNTGLASALRESLAEGRDLKSELRIVKDSILAFLDEYNRNTRLSRRALSALHFDSRLPASFDNGDRRLKVVSLTFDGDHHTNALRAILDTLHSRNVKATMFLTGGFVERHPNAVRAILKGGHEVGNHSYSHPHLTTWETTHSHATYPGVNRATVFNQLGRTARAYRKLTGKDMSPLWRAPYGEKNRQICRWAQEAGFLHVGWKQGRTWMDGFDTNDWVPNEDSPLYRSPNEVLAKFAAVADRQPHGLNGGVILMHLGTLREKRNIQMHRSLGKLIDLLRAKGYSLVPVSDMAAMSRVELSLLGTRTAGASTKSKR